MLHFDLRPIILKSKQDREDASHISISPKPKVKNESEWSKRSRARENLEDSAKEDAEFALIITRDKNCRRVVKLFG